MTGKSRQWEIEGGRQDLLEVIDDRVNTSSIAITSQLPISECHAYLGEPTIADAILDRIVHTAHRIQLQGESMRKLNGLRQQSCVTARS